MMHSVLIVDDEPHFCDSLDVLLKAAGYHVDIAHSGETAADYFKANTYSAALVDIGLPDIYGNDLAAQAVKEQSDTAIIIITGNATLDNAVEALRHGVYDYLRKPCSPERLLNTVIRGIQHKQLEKDLRYSEKRFRQLSQATWEGIIIYNAGKLLQVNSQLCTMFGYLEEELLGKQIFEILLDRKSVKSMSLPSGADTIAPLEARGIKKDGTSFPVELRIKHIDYQGNQVQVAAIRDVTVNELATQQKLELQQKLVDAQRMESLGLMASSVAHDLNNIMAGIITFPELLLLDLEKDFKYRDEIKMIRDAGKRAAAVVDDILTVARGSNCKKEVQNVNILISTYLDSVEYKEIQQRFPGIRVNAYLEDKLLNINCSAVHLSKSLINLVNNAAEAIQASGQITIASKNLELTKPINGYEPIPQGEYVLLSVEDDGPGISKEDLKHIFNPFYSKKKMGRSGTGLGLAVVWNTIHDHNGYIDLRTKDTGTHITLYFPVTRSPYRRPVEATSPATISGGNGERILVVDDKKSQREIARRLLSRLGYQAHTVKSGEEAVEYIKSEPVDLVILDMLMDPGINGCETYLRILEHAPGQKAIITSGYSSNEDLDKAKELGITKFIKKPYSLQELSQVLRLEIQ